MGQHQRIDPALARVVEALADLMAERDLRAARTGLTHAHDHLRPIFQRPAEPAIHS